MRLILSLTALLTLSACAAGVGANAGSDDNHPAVCAEQNQLARAGLRDGRQQSIACPDHGIGPRLGQGGVAAAAPAAQTAAYDNEYNRNADLYRAGFDGLVATLPQN